MRVQEVFTQKRSVVLCNTTRAFLCRIVEETWIAYRVSSCIVFFLQNLIVNTNIEAIIAIHVNQSMKEAGSRKEKLKVGLRTIVAIEFLLLFFLLDPTIESIYNISRIEPLLFVRTLMPSQRYHVKVEMLPVFICIVPHSGPGEHKTMIPVETYFKFIREMSQTKL